MGLNVIRRLRAFICHSTHKEEDRDRQREREMIQPKPTYFLSDAGQDWRFHVWRRGTQ